MEYGAKRPRLSGATKFKLQTAQGINDATSTGDSRGVIDTAVVVWSRARNGKGIFLSLMRCKSGFWIWGRFVVHVRVTLPAPRLSRPQGALATEQWEGEKFKGRKTVKFYTVLCFTSFSKTPCMLQEKNNQRELKLAGLSIVYPADSWYLLCFSLVRRMRNQRLAGS